MSSSRQLGCSWSSPRSKSGTACLGRGKQGHTEVLRQSAQTRSCQGDRAWCYAPAVSPAPPTQSRPAPSHSVFHRARNDLADADRNGGELVPEGSVKAAPKKRLRGIVSRLSWGLADQGMSSISNFAVTIYVARELHTVQFGAFSLAYVTYAFALSASRGIATDPLMVRFNNAERSVWRQAVAGSSATACMVGLVTGSAVLAAAALLHGPTKAAFVALGIVLPSLLLQDSWRYAFFANGRGYQAFINDSIWTLAIIPGIAYLRIAHSKSVFSFILVWGAAAALAAAAGPLQSGVIPKPSRVAAWLRIHRDLGLRYLGENTCNA